MQLASSIFLIVEPTEAISLVSMRKQREQIKKWSQMECVLVLKEVNFYAKTKMLEEGIPFILDEKQIYLPFMGIVLASKMERLLSEIVKISFLTQKFLLVALYERWEKISVTQVAKALCVSKMSVTRCFDEIEALGLSLIRKLGRSRYFLWEESRVDLWNFIVPYLHNPIKKVYRLDELVNLNNIQYGGISALSYYTMLADSHHQIFAVSNELAKVLELDQLPCIPKGEIPALTIQVMQYEIPYGDGKAIDPLTAILTLTMEEKDDPRVESAIEKLLEELLNDNRD